jgi:hypothetical protein
MVLFAVAMVGTVIFATTDYFLMRKETPFEFAGQIAVVLGGLIVIFMLIFFVLMAVDELLFPAIIFGLIAFATKLMLGVAHLNCLGLSDKFEKYGAISIVGFVVSAGCLLGFCVIGI